jgi:hypothetical protein
MNDATGAAISFFVQRNPMNGVVQKIKQRIPPF